jgi:hypothetical protein
MKLWFSYVCYPYFVRNIIYLNICSVEKLSKRLNDKTVSQTFKSIFATLTDFWVVLVSTLILVFPTLTHRLSWSIVFSVTFSDTLLKHLFPTIAKVCQCRWHKVPKTHVTTCINVQYLILSCVDEAFWGKHS